MPVNPLRTVFVRLNTSAHLFPRLHARSFSKAGHVGGIEYSTLLKEGREEVTGKRVLVY